MSEYDPVQDERCEKIARRIGMIRMLADLQRVKDEISADNRPASAETEGAENQLSNTKKTNRPRCDR